MQPTNENATQAILTSSVSNVYHTAFLLREWGLPGDVIPKILDYAGCWLTVSGLYRDFMTRVKTNDGRSRVHIIVNIPMGLTPQSLHRITFAYSDFKNGTSWDVRNPTCYGGSWSWTEGVVYCKDSEDQSTIFCPKRLVTNRASDAIFIASEVEWQWPDDEDCELRRLARSVPPSQQLSIVSCNRFPAWLTETPEAKMRFDFAVIRRM